MYNVRSNDELEPTASATTRAAKTLSPSRQPKARSRSCKKKPTGRLFKCMKCRTAWEWAEYTVKGERLWGQSRYADFPLISIEYEETCDRCEEEK